MILLRKVTVSAALVVLVAAPHWQPETTASMRLVPKSKFYR